MGPAKTGEKDRQSRQARIVSWGLGGAVVLIVIAIAFSLTCVGPSSYMAKVMFPGESTTNIADYPRMRAHMMTRYPWAPDFLLPNVPSDAVVVFFWASDMEALQASAGLSLEITLSTQDAQAELQRLRQLDPSGQYRDATDFPFVDGFEAWARASYDPVTRTFVYKIGSD